MISHIHVEVDTLFQKAVVFIRAYICEWVSEWVSECVCVCVCVCMYVSALRMYLTVNLIVET